VAFASRIIPATGGTPLIAGRGLTFAGVFGMLRKAALTRQPKFQVMILRISLSLAAVLFLLGCNKATQSTDDSKAGAAAPGTKAGGSSAAAGETKTTASGLKYQVLKQGTGTVSPKATDTVNVHYHGTLLNGTVFDSSVQRGLPISFPLNGVIPGWTEGLQLMKVGDKFKFEIPPNLAYGPNSPTPAIPPNSTLVFEVELLGIK
jgi:peptidylprolyl isomerase